MSIIRVNPESVRAYGTKAGDQFAQARMQLEAMVRAAVEVHYYGPNAVQFKEACGRMAADYSDKLLKDMMQIADAVKASTSNIAASLGGTPVIIAVNGSPVPVPPVPPADGNFDVDPAALEALKPVITRHVAAVHTNLREHLSTLTATDWAGQAKQSAVDAVTSFTNLAQGKATEAEHQINLFVSNQIDSVLAADR